MGKGSGSSVSRANKPMRLPALLVAVCLVGACKRQPPSGVACRIVEFGTPSGKVLWTVSNGSFAADFDSTTIPSCVGVYDDGSVALEVRQGRDTASVVSGRLGSDGSFISDSSGGIPIVIVRSGPTIRAGIRTRRCSETGDGCLPSGDAIDAIASYSCIPTRKDGFLHCY